MCEAIKDVFQIAAWCGGVATALLAVYQMKLNLRQRKEEVRWKVALQAKALLDEVFKSPKASSALRMLDWSGRKYNNEDGDIFVITKTEFKSYLRTDNLEFSPKEAYVRDCFDDLFSHLDMIEHYIKISLILFDDVRVPFLYYVKIMQKNHVIFDNFLSFYGYGGTLDFLSRLQEWTTASDVSPGRASDAA